MCFAFQSNRGCFAAPLLLVLIAAGPAAPLSAQEFTYTHAPISEVVRDIEVVTPYRFLFRDALVSGIRVSFEADKDGLLSEFAVALEANNLRLQIDTERNMVFVLPAYRTTTNASIRGTISDSRSLERLPHATVFWKDSRGLRGTAADDAGRFLIELEPTEQRVVLAASYLGYVVDTLFLDPHKLPSDLSIKLEPRVMVGSEVVVSSPLLSSNLDSTWFYLLNASLAAPAGEQSVTRGLQALPAVGLTTAVSSGLNVRGSRTDGFQILLDGIPIYNQSHLFGMFDAFNPDALQTVDFYYGIAPARFQAPPGGTLSFLTRTGSKNRFRNRFGFTNTSVSATTEGPAGGGKGSWILSGRRSYLDRVDWFNNDQLVAVGLGVGRETSGTRRIPLDERTLITGPPSASFYDVHAKFDYESRTGSTFQINTYAGGDDARQSGERVVAVAPQRQDPLLRSSVTTANDWGNASSSIHYRSAVKPWGYTHTYAGFTRYHSTFRKDDFFYRAPQQGNADPQLLFAPFLNENSLSDLRVAHDASVVLSPALAGAAGLSVQHLASHYRELSALRREFESDQGVWQVDFFAEVTHKTRTLTATLGMRPHYYSEGRYLRLSPRLSVLAFANSAVSASAGYARNYQFTHRLYIENAPGSDIWVLSTEDEGPGAVDHLTASILYRRHNLTAQVEGYIKWQENLRRHETILRPGSVPGGAVLFTPWTHDNEARALGLEALVTRRLGPASLTATYTLSETVIRHPDLNSGTYFPADWDRPHQFALHAQFRLAEVLSASLSWNIASGQPNPIAYADPSQPTRYPTYKRMDLALQYRTTISSLDFDAFFRIYNLLDTRNTWYRTIETVVLGRGQNIRLAYEPIDVYDLGIQPSFGLSLSL